MLVVPNDIIKFKTTVIDGIGMGEDSKSFPQEAIKVVLIHNRTECCTVGFLCKSIVVVKSDKARFVGHFAQIIELYDESATKTMMLKCKTNMGIASFQLLDEIQDQEQQKITNSIYLMSIAYICHVLSTSHGEI